MVELNEKKKNKKTKKQKIMQVKKKFTCNMYHYMKKNVVV